ncbi:hypothetical protein ASPWEDRAFT_174000 [Aspergillus wentii DTO 134E9]|uniref:Uncharacterized protein n=1 Tax=Aspergillus wentii DTO 134E9 TaxID=1073089 RepID=A0A1L9RI97_ASPWE|nr:uncharacterized protein ASPWEDRAFT_174000 [Aspergillus wentii DTO 134E9]KAI9925910.1 hypothetical protein MW887_005716 [Aspergillus wentii]OJJ34593.1 hypothetical protein ASPWEDRAFT_174000 [Aspergillus wentii DTO 134E9]
MSSLSTASQDTNEPSAPSGDISPVTSWPPEESDQEFTSSCCGVERKSPTEWNNRTEMIINKPYEYLISLGGKEFRRQFLQALNVWLKVDESKCNVVNDTINMLHNGSLLIDDIQDESRFRRGSLAAHEVYGIAQTINTANYVYFKAQQSLLQLDKWPALMKIFNEELLHLHRGQGMELFWRDTLQPPSQEDYIWMSMNKTGGLFRLTLRLLQTLSDCTYDIQPLAETVGLLFQIVDDYKNLKDSTMIDHKGFFEDLTEGKFSFPISHAIWTNSDKKSELLRIMRMKTTDDDLKRFVVQCLEEGGSLQYTREFIHKLHLEAMHLLSQIPEPNPLLEKLVLKLQVPV